jgi:hypothetical protein
MHFSTTLSSAAQNHEPNRLSRRWQHHIYPVGNTTEQPKRCLSGRKIRGAIPFQFAMARCYDRGSATRCFRPVSCALAKSMRAPGEFMIERAFLSIVLVVIGKQVFYEKERVSRWTLLFLQCDFFSFLPNKLNPFVYFQKNLPFIFSSWLLSLFFSQG